MKIRNARSDDLNTIFDIYDRARAFMRDNGNPEQWGYSYPPHELVLSDLENQNLYVVESEDGSLAGVFSCFPEGDRAYDTINGKWLNDKPYTAVHRVASAGTHKGLFSAVLDFCLQFSDNIKIDTHKQNTVMQHVLKKHGFVQCGTIITDGLPFLAFQLVKN